jgi:TFIIF-interacting CTD phosphatase-like protein
MIDLQFKKTHTRKVIFFDLDETLAHCVRHQNLLKEPDVVLNIPTPSGKILTAQFNIRPHTQEILECANKHFEVCVFTASNPGYADTILDYIDPTGELI